MNVSLTPKLEAFVRERVASGLYNNSSEVVREALRLLHEQVGKRTPPEKAAIRKAIARIEDGLRAKGVTALYLFGSVARGEAAPAAMSTCWSRSIPSAPSPCWIRPASRMT